MSGWYGGKATLSLSKPEERRIAKLRYKFMLHAKIYNHVDNILLVWYAHDPIKCCQGSKTNKPGRRLVLG
jgi:hypothetical protein